MALKQAALFHARQRRRSLAGVPDLPRSHRIVGSGQMAVASIDDASFTSAVRAAAVTFKTAIRIDAASPSGLVFELGATARGAALWVSGQTINFRAGAAAAADRGLATFDYGAAFPNGVELDIVAAARPGNGLVQIWLQGHATVRNQSSSGDFDGDWMGDGDGSFASAVQGTTPADVAVTTAPANFTVIEPLSIYTGVHPRQMVAPAT